MRLSVSSRYLSSSLAAVLFLGTALLMAADDAPTAGREVPEALAPFEYLVGGWKGTGIPQANKLKGWDETHAWAWKFEKGVPIGLTVSLQANKTLAKGVLTRDAASKAYVLNATGVDGKPAKYVGGLEADKKTILFEREGGTSDGAKQRIAIKPAAGFVRYTLTVSEQEPGAPRFKPVFVTGLTKDGESFAAGSTSGSDAPKCIVTGGAATFTVSYQGKTFPLCCTGCKEEFQENPEKYVKKLALRAAEGSSKTAARPASSKNNDDAFDGVTDAKPGAKASGKSAAKAMTKAEAASPKEPAPTSKAGSSESISKAASLLRLGQNLEKSGKTSAALGYYRQLVKSYAGTPSAKTAAERIKALEEK